MQLNSARLLPTVLLASTLLALTACDGGLFGTGDGADSDITVGANSPGETDGGTGFESDPSLPPSATPPSNMAPDGTPPPSQPVETSAFTNTLSVTDRDNASLAVLNLTDDTVQVQSAATGDNLYASPIAPQTVSAVAAIPVGSTISLNIVEDASLEPLNQLGPLTLAAGSSSTAVVFGPSSSTAVTIHGNEVATTDVTQARIRLVLLTNNLMGEPGDGEVNLNPINDTTGSAQSLGILAADNVPSDYIDITPGEYQLTDVNQRFAAQSFSFVAGRVVTLVVDGSDVYRVEDSTIVSGSQSRIDSAR